MAGGLSQKARQYWQDKQKLIDEGIIHAGKFERYFRYFRRIVLPLIHKQKTIRSLLAEKSTTQQSVFYQQVWDNWQWRIFFRLFFSKRLMGSLGRDPAFLQTSVGTCSKIYIPKICPASPISPCTIQLLPALYLVGEFWQELTALCTAGAFHEHPIQY